PDHTVFARPPTALREPGAPGIANHSADVTRSAADVIRSHAEQGKRLYRMTAFRGAGCEEWGNRVNPRVEPRTMSRNVPGRPGGSLSCFSSSAFWPAAGLVCSQR